MIMAMILYPYRVKIHQCCETFVAIISSDHALSRRDVTSCHTAGAVRWEFESWIAMTKNVNEGLRSLQRYGGFDGIGEYTALGI